ncbi:MAG: hypothetical protein QOE61_3429 [Micromonosporaceae bacterium]|jgi:hypothetical protein|nr:hypothetical protein [Micromonosporaceae bacterium]
MNALFRRLTSPNHSDPGNERSTGGEGNPQQAFRSGGNSRRLRVWHAVAVAILAVPLALAIPTAAQAAPTSCSTGTQGGNGSYAVCTRGTGAYRSFTQCQHWYWPNSWYINYGPWQVPSNPVWSISYCGTGDSRHAYGVDLS